MATPRAQLHNVSLTYDGGSSWALKNLSLTINEGERLCILGANGSGKSTLAQLLSGLEAPDEGTVELAGPVVFKDGMPNTETYREARRRTGLVFQNPEDQIVTSITEDDVAFGPENLAVEHKEIVTRVSEELERVALSDFAKTDPARLSGGQQQRLAIAGALAKHGDMLILDEPGAMLDVRGRRGIMRVLSELQASGTTIVHITHFLDEARAASRVIVMNKGSICLDGTPDEVLSQTKILKEVGLVVQDKLAPAMPRQTSQDIAIKADSISYAYGAAPILKNISFTVKKGSVTALIGHTGSGKSTLARLLCALDTPTTGAISICGMSTTNKKERRALRGAIGYVMQLPERQLFAETVFDDIAFGPRNMHLDKDEIAQRVNEQLASFGLSSKAHVSPFELSGGQQRMVALAGVLAMQPEVLVLDEPTAGLDPTGAYRINKLISELACSGNTILLITHSMEDVAHLADHVIVLSHGSVALSGTTSEVFAQEATLHAIGLGVPKNATSPAQEVRPC